VGRKKEATKTIFYCKTFFIFLCLVFCNFHGKIFAQTSLPEQDKYIMKTYMVIPWGDGKGQLALKTSQVRKHEPEPDTPEAVVKNSKWFKETVTKYGGPSFFKVDDEGNVYIYDYVGKTPALKKFNSSGKETACLTDNPPDKFTIQNNKIVTTDFGAREVKYLSLDDFSVVEKFIIPKDFDLTYSKTLNGVIYKPVVKDSKKLFVFDNKERLNNPGAENKYLYHFSDGKHVGLKMGESEILNLTSKSKEWTTEEIFHWRFAFQDKYGNYYLVAETTPEHFDFVNRDISERSLFKFNGSGTLLFALKTHRETYQSFSLGDERLDIDYQGNIYNCWSDNEGFHIDKYQYLNETEKQ
jgi:hypothetical protein